MCDRDIATNFGAVVGDVILVDSCFLVLCCDLFYLLLFLFILKKKNIFVFAAVLFKTDLLVELGIGLLFPEGKRRSEKN